MNKYKLSWIQLIYINHAHKDYSHLIKNWIVVLLTVLFGVSLSAYLEIHNKEAAMKNEIQTISQQFVDFLNGGTLISADQKFAARCTNLMEVVN